MRFAIIAMLWVLSAAATSTASAAEGSAAVKDDERAQLSIGYSLLYLEANGIPKLNWILMLKEKSSDMAQLTSDLVRYYKQLADSMQKLSEQYPAMRIDVEPMSKIEGEARKAMGSDQAKDMAPISGKTGIDFERQALLLFYNALDEQRHLVSAMLERESSPPLRKFLQTTKTQLDERHARIGSLLNRRYFTH